MGQPPAEFTYQIRSHVTPTHWSGDNKVAYLAHSKQEAVNERQVLTYMALPNWSSAELQRLEAIYWQKLCHTQSSKYLRRYQVKFHGLCFLFIPN